MYDTIVIGNDVSSLVAATMLSRRGRKTVLISEGDNQYVYTESGYTFHIDPLPLTGFGTDQICSHLFSSLGIPRAESTDLHLLNPCFQIILPDHRVDFFYDQEKLLADLEREFPRHAEDIRNIYASISNINDFIQQWLGKNPYLYPSNYKELFFFIKKFPRLMKERLRLSKKFQAIKKNPSLQRAFEAQIVLFSNIVQNFHSNIDILTAYILSLPLRGMYYHTSSKESLMRSLRSIFIHSGGLLINNCSVNSISIKKEINIAIDTYDKLSAITGRYLIASTKWEKCGSLLLNEQRFRRLKRRLKLLEVFYYPFTLHMGVHEKGFPEKMATHIALVCNNGHPVMDNNIVFVESSSSGETERAPSGKRVLSATVFLKESPLTLSDGKFRDISASIFQSLETFLPFLKENLDYINIDKSIELSKKYQDLVSLKYGMQAAPFLGLTNISPHTPVRNVFIAGGMLLAGLGFEGEILSGVNAATAIIKQGE